MLQFPRWRVDVTIGGDIVKTFYETATTSAAAIGKAKHKMRGAVSSAGAFKFKAAKAEAGKPEHHHATKAAPKSQREMYYDAERRSGEINKTFLEMLPTMRRRDLEKLIEKRPALWGRFAGYLTSGHVFVDDPPGGARHHSTKKSPAQLQREIDEVLASPGSFSYEEAMAALEKKHAGVKRGGSLRSGHTPVAPRMPTSVLQMLKGYKARVRFEDQLKRPNRDLDRPRWTAFVQGAFGHDAVGEGTTKEGAARAAVAQLPPHIRRHFEGV
jgi:hypothetical protein